MKMTETADTAYIDSKIIRIIKEGGGKEMSEMAIFIRLLTIPYKKMVECLERLVNNTKIYSALHSDSEYFFFGIS